MLKSDYFRIEIILNMGCEGQKKGLKSDYFRIEIITQKIQAETTLSAKIRLF